MATYIKNDNKSINKVMGNGSGKIFNVVQGDPRYEALLREAGDAMKQQQTPMLAPQMVKVTTPDPALSNGLPTTAHAAVSAAAPTGGDQMSQLISMIQQQGGGANAAAPPTNYNQTPAGNDIGSILGGLASTIGGMQAANPVAMPFAAGTKTLASTQADRDYQLSLQNAATAAYNATHRSSGGGGGSPKEPTLTEQKNEVLNSLTSSVMAAKDKGWTSQQVIYDLMQEMDGAGNVVSPADINKLVLGLYGEAAASSSGASGGTTNPFANGAVGSGAVPGNSADDLHNWFAGIKKNGIGH